MRWGSGGRFSTETAQARFLAKVNKTSSGCWMWTGAIGASRYGCLTLMGKPWLAHRAAWFLFRDQDPGDQCVCHKCDVGLCVNPDHLFLGTQADNVHDMERKGRSYHPSCEDHGRAKLSNEDADAIRKRRAEGASLRQLAREYGVAKESISRIVKNEGWFLPDKIG